jgi:AcrR family transcriptional regulator
MPAQIKTRQTREPLTRERIVAAALRVMDEEGLEAVTMRRVGRELGVEAMSLYNHVTDKDDILNGIADEVMAGFDFPGDTDDWKEDARRASRAWRTLLMAHPNVMVLLSERRSPITSPDALRPTEHALSILRRAGLSPEDTVRAFRAFGGYIQGFVLMELANMFGEDASPGTAAPWALDLPEDTFPMLCGCADYLVHCDPAADFEFGLELLIHGLEAKAATRS